LIREINEIIKPYKNNQKNYLGSDVSPKKLEQINSLAKGGDLKEPSVEELAFWRWVAFEGYDGVDPRLFKYQQAIFMADVFSATGWALEWFSGKNILEIGCGPYGMIEIFTEDTYRLAYDPLNDEYDRLFSEIRSKSIHYTTAWQEILEGEQEFDLVICFNVLDHTEHPKNVLAHMMHLLKSRGRFLIQVNTVREGCQRTPEHQKMHPSPIEVAMIQEMISAYSDSFTCNIENTPSKDNEFWFMAWGNKK
jgi:2-polyprenyl-3-methyl-5-hydroxy-6-metoxy-1,4-benzoquinol methylase